MGFGGHCHHPDHIAIAISKECQRSLAHGFDVASLVGGDGQITPHFFVGQRLDHPEFVASQCAHVTEIEAQPLRCHKGTGLADGSAQHRAQSSVEDMSAAVVSGRIKAARQFNLGGYRVADRYFALGNGSPLNYQSGHRTLSVFHGNDAVGAADGTTVAQLSTAFCIERRLANDDLYLLTLCGMVNGYPTR